MGAMIAETSGATGVVPRSAARTTASSDYHPSVRSPVIRAMTADDADPAADAVLRAEWGDRRTFFRFATGHPECRPFVADADGSIVGTAIGTVNGAVGWIGTVWVEEAQRGRGLGRALTGAVIEALESAGCPTLLLVATDAGRALYERLGFAVASSYRIVEVPGLGNAGRPGPGGSGTRPRPYAADDLGAMTALDRSATGEDRGHLLAAFANPTSTRCAVRPDGILAGFIVRARWGGGATIAPDPAVAATLLDDRRRRTPATGHVRAGLLEENEDGLARLAALGWTEAWRAPRMARGADLEWDPEAIWGQFNHALG
jgi:ribosomal protein S18 acetylase RimI-like enzyme